jgi:hypothetical protein
MARTKSRGWRNLEEKSVNPLSGPDGEVQNADVVATEGHDATVAGGENVIIGQDADLVAADAKGKKGDDGSHSPGDFLNLNQHEDDTEAEENVATQTTTYVRRGRGPNRMPSRWHVITKVNDAREPTKPTASVNTSTTSLGKVVREKMIITYRLWKSKNPDKYVVPDHIKEDIWNTLISKFEFPKECGLDLVRRKTLSGLGLAFRNFKSRLYIQFHQKGQTADLNEYPTLKPFWKAFT